MILLKLLVSTFVVVGASGECSLGESSCSNCMQLPSCYWCSTGTEKCKSFINTELAQLFCPNNWFHDRCPAESESLQKKSKLEEMLNLLHNLKVKHQEQETIQETPLVPGNDAQTIVSNELMSQNTDTKATGTAASSTGTSSSDLKELLHKLLLLKLLRKVKSEGSATLTDEDKLLLYELKSKATQAPTTKAPATESNVNNQLAELLQILKNEAAQQNNKEKILESLNLKATASAKLVSSTIASTSKQKHTSNLSVSIKGQSTGKPALTLNNRLENVDIDYVEEKGDKLPSLHVTAHKNVTTIQTRAPVNGYCRLYEGRLLCNKDSNCTWCNPADKCIHRTNDGYEGCSQLMKFDIDPCFKSKHCKQCVRDEKCYWCDESKSCHTYPFFGYVPHGCSGNWYVKQCDVQLAVIIIVLPLIMILLAMVTFYFCLKYCYYKRKVLRVPLFEKPGVFDYRKDKKVYFVHPDDESSENEMETEKFRKKYRLPMERAPLIDPNS